MDATLPALPASEREVGLAVSEQGEGKGGKRADEGRTGAEESHVQQEEQRHCHAQMFEAELLVRLVRRLLSGLLCAFGGQGALEACPEQQGGRVREQEERLVAQREQQEERRGGKDEEQQPMRRRLRMAEVRGAKADKVGVEGRQDWRRGGCNRAKRHELLCEIRRGEANARRMSQART
jgi:hypothetical protein